MSTSAKAETFYGSVDPVVVQQTGTSVNVLCSYEAFAKLFLAMHRAAIELQSVNRRRGTGARQGVKITVWRGQEWMQVSACTLPREKA